MAGMRIRVHVIDTEWPGSASAPFGAGHGPASKCTYAPATHAGSFKCRFHRTNSQGHGHGQGQGSRPSSPPSPAMANRCRGTRARRPRPPAPSQPSDAAQASASRIKNARQQRGKGRSYTCHKKGNLFTAPSMYCFLVWRLITIRELR
ncbi:hypothetical protein VPH35_052612 [Triticum aestivum]|uniref:Uncharacterized protein n=1 Tax=Triticum aestivum TaxID=4565 RepID=A0A077S2F9_WHEAT|nr:unnamed protein product [Triticum aestivum]